MVDKIGKTEAGMLEKDVEKYLVKRVREADGIAYKFISPGHNGVPDRICVLPDGVVVFVEVKQPNGRLSPTQTMQIQSIYRRGHNVAVVWSKEDVDCLITEYTKGEKQK